jgi:quercetin dioxygenase-like cupin family protein
MKSVLSIVVVGLAGIAAFTEVLAHDRDASEPIFKLYKDQQWERLAPEMGDASPELCILHTDPRTKATKMLIRSPVASGARKHWHTASETHTVIQGQVIYECDGRRVQMGPGSFNLLPPKMVHEAWSSAGSLVFVTLDGPWDIHYVDGMPTAADIIKDPTAFFAEPAK